jgi:hypothetical protein
LILDPATYSRSGSRYIVVKKKISSTKYLGVVILRTRGRCQQFFPAVWKFIIDRIKRGNWFLPYWELFKINFWEQEILAQQQKRGRTFLGVAVG